MFHPIPNTVEIVVEVFAGIAAAPIMAKPVSLPITVSIPE